MLLQEASASPLRLPPKEERLRELGIPSITEFLCSFRCSLRHENIHNPEPWANLLQGVLGLLVGLLQYCSQRVEMMPDRHP